MRALRINIFLTIGILISYSCSSNSNDSGDLFAGLFTSPPLITSVTPNFGSPAQSNPNGSYVATEVILKGRNFGDTGSRVLFGGVEAAVTFLTPTEIRTSVPQNAVSGTVSVVKATGTCNADGRSGLNCGGADFFIDCYAPTNKTYGDEIVINQGSGRSVEYGTLETFAFRSDVNASGTIDIVCDSIVTVRVFKESCSSDDSVLVRNPTIPFTVKLNLELQQVLQFYVTASSATCRININ